MSPIPQIESFFRSRPQSRRVSIRSWLSATSSQDCTQKPGSLRRALSTEDTINNIVSRKYRSAGLEEERDYFPSGLSVLEPRPLVYWSSVEERMDIAGNWVSFSLQLHIENATEDKPGLVWLGGSVFSHAPLFFFHTCDFIVFPPTLLVKQKMGCLDTAGEEQPTLTQRVWSQDGREPFLQYKNP